VNVKDYDMQQIFNKINPIVVIIKKYNDVATKKLKITQLWKRKSTVKQNV